MADPAKVDAMRQRLGPGPIVGLSWLSHNRTSARQKSATLAGLAPLLKQSRYRFLDLQYGDTADERAALSRDTGLMLTHLDGVDLKNDLDSLAVMMMCCDVVITVCNTTAHLAAALGRPTWVLTSHERGRLWWTFLDRDDSPWYPTVKFFRQPHEGDWDTPINRAAEALALKSPG